MNNAAASHVLGLWLVGLKTEAEVQQWAANQVLQDGEYCFELGELATYGPVACLKRASEEFQLRPAPIPFEEQFVIRARLVNMESDCSVNNFGEWLAREVIGKDLTGRAVQFGYTVDHLLNDCQDPVAMRARIRKELPGLVSSQTIGGGTRVANGV